MCKLEMCEAPVSPKSFRGSEDHRPTACLSASAGKAPSDPTLHPWKAWPWSRSPGIRPRTLRNDEMCWEAEGGLPEEPWGPSSPGSIPGDHPVSWSHGRPQPFFPHPLPASSDVLSPGSASQFSSLSWWRCLPKLGPSPLTVLRVSLKPRFPPL